MTRVAVLGATGYTALEVMQLLLRHPDVEITALTTRSDERLHVSKVHPRLSGRLDLTLENLSVEEIALRADCVFSCLPHTASAQRVPELLDLGCRVIDLSADYRLDSLDVFTRWYAPEHPDPDRLGHVPYGLPEIFREQIRGAQLVANPGCYPTSAIIPLYPLLKAQLIKPNDIIIDSKSGASGAGRSLKPNILYCEVNESFSAYGVGTHRHTPEIEQVLGKGAGVPVHIIFTPHLVPMERGILSTTYSIPSDPDITQEKILETLRDFYAQEQFIRVTDSLPSTSDCRGTNYVNLTARLVNGRVLTISTLDNLIKGASGAAVQNFNLIFGYPENTALM